jgi:hypothetical protein
MDFFPENPSSFSIRHAGRKAVKAMRTMSGKVVIKKARKQTQPKFLHSMIRVGSDCSGLGTEILALNGIPALTDRVVHVFASEIDVAVAAIFNASHKVKQIYSDVTTRCPRATPVTDIYVNTSPCQPFSMMGSGELFEIDNLPFDFTITCKSGRHKTLLSSLLSALLL